MLPLSLYIHIPWCIQKCPYCDFNSHKSPTTLPEIDYVHALIQDLKIDIELERHHVQRIRPIHSIFIGGGTPRLLSEKAYGFLFEQLHQLLDLSQIQEITLEANPNSAETRRFKGYRALGINRLSIGVQSFNNQQLKTLGRAHDNQMAQQAIGAAREAGFERVNIDIMHSLPNQTLPEAITDLTTALALAPEHISWYQLTLEPNTVFYSKPPNLPEAELTYQIESEGQALLAQHGFLPYEISAYAKPQEASLHNLNYWQFGDYLGIGAGAHGKLSHPDLSVITRTQKMRQPKDYLNPAKPFMSDSHPLNHSARIFEFMLNATRLNQAIPHTLFTERTGLEFEHIAAYLKQAESKQLIHLTQTHWQVTDFGRQFTNDLQQIFL